jgi:hypothetical protein
MTHRILRQVLDCGDEVCKVTALPLAALKIPKLSTDTTRPKAVTPKTPSPHSKTLTRQLGLQSVPGPLRCHDLWTVTHPEPHAAVVKTIALLYASRAGCFVPRGLRSS